MYSTRFIYRYLHIQDQHYYRKVHKFNSFHPKTHSNWYHLLLLIKELNLFRKTNISFSKYQILLLKNFYFSSKFLHQSFCSMFYKMEDTCLLKNLNFMKVFYYRINQIYLYSSRMNVPFLDNLLLVYTFYKF